MCIFRLRVFSEASVRIKGNAGVGWPLMRCASPFPKPSV
jgi:hypothetical protein